MRSGAGDGRDASSGRDAGWGAGPEASPEDRFVAAFLLRADQVVVPALRDVGRMVEERGRFFSVERIAERRTCRGTVIPTSIQLNLFRRHRLTNYKNGALHFNVACDRTARRILFRRTVPSAAGAPEEDLGGCGLDALTRALVRDKAAAALVPADARVGWRAPA